MKILITDLQPGRDYNLQLRSKSGARVSAWSKTFRLPVPLDVVAPAIPTGLTVDIVGDSFLARWDEVTKDEDGTDIADFSHYVIRMRSVVTGETHELMVGRDTKYELTFNLNVGLFQEPAGIIEFSVAAVDNSWNSSDFCDPVIGANPAPNPVRNLVAKGIMEGISASWDPPEPMEDDFLEYRAYIVLSAAEDVTGLNPTWAGNATSFTYSTLTMMDQYVKVVAVDKFGSASTVETAGPVQPRSPNIVDIDAPAVPTDVAGSITGDTMTVSWTPPPNPDNDLAGYTVQYRPVAEGTVGWFMQTATHEDTSVEITVKPFVDYQIRVSAHDFSFNRSGYSAIVDVPGEINLAPAKVTGVDVRAALATAMVFWAENTEPDIKGYEVQFERQTPVDTDEVHSTTGTMVSFTEEVEDEVMFYARVRAVDNAGLKGEWSDVVSTAIGFPAWVGEWVAETGRQLEQKLTDASGDIIDAAARLADAEDALKDSTGQLINAGEWIELTGGQLQTNLTEAKQVLDQAFPTGPINVTQLIKTSVVQYAVNSSETTAPTSGWSANTPTRTPGSFIWFRTLITYANNTTTTSSPALLTGNAGAPGQDGQDGQPGQDGQQGDPGAPGVGITSVTPYFQQKAGTAPAKPTTLNPVAAWTTTEPNWVKDQSLYRTERVVYTNGTFSWTAVSKIASYEGIDAAMAAANGKNKSTYTDGVALPGPGPAPSVASGTGRAAGDTHRNRTSNGVIVGRWTWNGTNAWVQETLASGVMDSLDVGKITGGSAAFENFVSQNLTSNTGVINDLWTKVVRSQKITTDMLIVGQGDSLMPDLTSPDAWSLGADVTIAPATHVNFKGTHWFRFNNPSVWQSATSKVDYRVTPGDELLFRWRVRKGVASGQASPRLIFNDSAGNLVQRLYMTPVNNLDWGIDPIEISAAVPPNAATMLVEFAVTDGTAGDPPVYIGDFSLLRKAGSSLIVDGAVTAKKITITGDENNPDEVGLVANIASILHLTVDNLYVPGTATIETGIVNELWTQVVRSRKITTDMLYVGSGVNIVVDPGLRDSELTTYRLASSNGNWSLASTTGGAERFARTILGTGTSAFHLREDSTAVYTPIDPGQKYRIKYKTRGQPGSSMTTRPTVRYYTTTAGPLYTTVDQSGYASGSPDWVWIDDYTWTAPEDATVAYFEIQARGNSGFWVDVGLPSVTADGASLIVDGSIMAKAIDVGDLMADTGFITRLKSDFIDVALVDADRLIAGQGIINDLLIKANLIVNPGGIVQSANYSSSAGWRLTNNSLVINEGTISARALKLQVGQNSMPAAYANFEFPESFYNLSTINATTEITTAASKYGDQSLIIRAPVTGATRVRLTNASELRHNISVQAGETYILSLWAKGGNLANAFRFFPEYDGAVTPTLPYMTVPASSDWTRYSQTVVIPAGVSQMFLSLYMNSGTINRAFYVDGVQVEVQTGSSTDPSVWTPGSAFTAIDGGMIRTGEIRSNVLVSDGVSSTQPAWSLNANGGMQVGSAVVRGSLVVGTASTANTSFMQSGIWTASSGWRINADGSAEFRKITVGANQIDPSSISGGTITSPLVIASTIRTSSNNQRAQMDSVGFRYYNSLGAAIFSAAYGSVTMRGELITSTSANDGVSIKPDSSRLNNGIIEFLSTRTVNPYIAMEAGTSTDNSVLKIAGPKQGTVVTTPASIKLGWTTSNTSHIYLDTTTFDVHSSESHIGGYKSGGSKTSPGVAITGRHITLQSDLTGVANNVYVEGNLNVDNDFNVASGDMRVGPDSTSTAATMIRFNRVAAMGSLAGGNNLDLMARGSVYVKAGVAGTGNTWTGTPTNYLQLHDNGRTTIITGLINQTTTIAGNVYVNSSGSLYRSTSLSEYKIVIEDADVALSAVKSLRPVTYYDKGTAERRADQMSGLEVEALDIEPTVQQLGLLAEEVEAAGVPGLAMYGTDGELNGVAYERVGVALIPWLHELEGSNAELRQENAELRGMIEDLAAKVAGLLET